MDGETTASASRRAAEAAGRPSRKRPRAFAADACEYRVVASETPDATPLRAVVPYVHHFDTNVKGRWVGKTLAEVYAREFLDRRSREAAASAGAAPATSYFDSAIRSGMIRVCGERSAADRVIRNGEYVTHVVHRHEPPVLHVPARDMVVSDDGDVVVVNKPASMPVHPAGGYNFNSVTQILAREAGLQLKTVHRLDRLTSGVLVLTRSADSARELGKAMCTHGVRVRKAYVAKVRGKFPETDAELRASPRARACLGSGFKRGGGAPAAALDADAPDAAAPDADADAEEDGGGAAAAAAVPPPGVAVDDATGEVSFSYPVRVLDPRQGRHGCDLDGGKPSASKFRFVSHDAATDTSLVRCEPVTGRTHQLRLHLQRLGFPIANDPDYGDAFEAHRERAARAADDDGDDAGFAFKRGPYGYGAVEAPRAVGSREGGAASPALRTLEDEALGEEHRVRACCALCQGPPLPVRLYHPGLWLHALHYAVLSPDGAVQHDWRVPPPKWVADDARAAAGLSDLYLALPAESAAR